MNPIRNVRRVAGVLAGLASAWLGLALAAPAAFAATHPIPGRAGYLTPGEPGAPFRSSSRRCRCTAWWWAGCPAGRSR